MKPWKSSRPLKTVSWPTGKSLLCSEMACDNRSWGKASNKSDAFRSASFGSCSSSGKWHSSETGTSSSGNIEIMLVHGAL